MDADGSHNNPLTPSAAFNADPSCLRMDRQSCITPALPPKMAGASAESWNQSELVSIHPDGSHRIDLTNNTWLDQCPVGSPDGTRIAWTSCESGNREVWVINVDGSGKKQITFTRKKVRR